VYQIACRYKHLQGVTVAEKADLFWGVGPSRKVRLQTLQAWPRQRQSAAL
jgi:hypothetical protein